MDAKIIATQLSSRIQDVVRYLLPDGTQKNNEWVLGSLQGEPGQSLKIRLTGPKAGIWSDFATGEAGDALDLWKAVKGLDTKSALNGAASWLGHDLKPTFYPKRIEQYYKAVEKNWTETVPDDPVPKYLTDKRGLNEKTIKLFEIGIRGNDIVFPFKLGKIISKAKYLSLIRNGGKKKISVSPNTPSCLFGWHALKADLDEITLTEGEIDAMSLYQMGYPALSLPFGGGTGAKHDWIDYEFENLKQFKKINICLDQDSVGQSSIKEVVTRLGRHRCHVVQLPCKDANDFLLSTKQNANEKPISCYFENALECAPSELCNAGKYYKLVEEHFFPTESSFTGYLSPWENLSKHFLFRRNELSIWSGINGHGKSQLLGQIALHLSSQGGKVLIASLEMPPRVLLSRLVYQLTCQRNPSKAHLHMAFQWFQQSLWIYENRTSFSSKKLIEIMDYARCCHGIDIFIIDSLMKCGLGEEDYNGQKAFIEDLCNFKNIHDCQIHLITHPRKMKDESTSPGKMDIKGSGAITDLADNCFSIWRNKKVASNPKEHDAKLTCYKQRNGDWEGDLYLWFDQQSCLFTEKVNAPLKPYIELKIKEKEDE